MVTDPYVSITMISVSLAGLYAFKSRFWALPTLFLSRETASVSIATINSIENLGGIVGPFAIGYIKGNGNSATTGLQYLSVLLVVSFLMTLFININEQKTVANSPEGLARQSSALLILKPPRVLWRGACAHGRTGAI